MTKSKVPSQQPFNVKPIHGKKRTRRQGAEDSDYVRDIVAKAHAERKLIAGRKK
jgi:hypothetical protein